MKNFLFIMQMTTFGMMILGLIDLWLFNFLPEPENYLFVTIAGVLTATIGFGMMIFNHIEKQDEINSRLEALERKNNE